MIDVIHENLLTLAEVPTILPKRKSGKRTHVATIYRWATCGCRGVVLETIQIGNSRCTSEEALTRFFHRLTQAAKENINSNQNPESHEFC